MYSDEAIRERIEKEDISFYREQQKEVQPVLCKCKVRRYRSFYHRDIALNRQMSLSMLMSHRSLMLQKVPMHLMEVLVLSQ